MIKAAVVVLCLACTRPQRPDGVPLPLEPTWQPGWWGDFLRGLGDDDARVA
jgi:hypothetical protein